MARSNGDNNKINEPEPLPQRTCKKERESALPGENMVFVAI